MADATDGSSKTKRVVVRVNDCFSALVQKRSTEIANFTETEEYTECWKITRVSTAGPVTKANWGKLGHHKLKAHVRDAVGPSVRSSLWLSMLVVSDDDSVLFAKDFGEPVNGDGHEHDEDFSFGLPFDPLSLPVFFTKPVFPSCVCQLLRTLKHSRHRLKDTCPLLPVLAHVMLHFLEEWEVYAGLVHLLKNRAWLEQGLSELRAGHGSLMALCHSHCKSSLSELCRLKPSKMQDDVFLRLLTQHWYYWPFFKQPFWVMVRVMDMYLVEGPKVLYRLALGAVRMYSMYAQAIVEGSPVERSMEEFLSNLSPQLKEQWFHEAFSIARLPWASVLRLWSTQLSQAPQVSRGAVECVDSTSSPPPEFGSKCTVEPDPTSEIIGSTKQWQTIWHWLPHWVLCEKPDCLFRASRDGYNLRTMYRKSQDVYPLVLAVRSTKGEVFGAFIASDLGERHNSQFFGTGESFLFTLLPEPNVYMWSAATDLILRGTDHELVVGSGGGQFGLWLDEDLNRGSTSTCLAFQNPPLTGADTQFSVAAVELYSCA